MKKIMPIILSFILCIGLFTKESYSLPTSNNLKTSARDYVIHGEDFVPIPWGYELPITWYSLTGTWMLKQSRQTASSYFTFQAINNNKTNKMLYIQQIDPNSCQILGTGVASQLDLKIIYATLRSAVNNQVYRINFRNFDANSFNSMVLPSFQGHIMMMSIAPINSHEFVNFSLDRVNFGSSFNIKCRERLVR